MWLAALGLAVVIGGLAALGVSPAVPTAIAVVVILVIAAPRRAKDLGAREMRDSDPEN
jgi:hypothetical protein